VLHARLHMAGRRREGLVCTHVSATPFALTSLPLLRITQPTRPITQVARRVPRVKDASRSDGVVMGRSTSGNAASAAAKSSAAAGKKGGGCCA
jgi:hypothetical protein